MGITSLQSYADFFAKRKTYWNTPQAFPDMECRECLDAVNDPTNTEHFLPETCDSCGAVRSAESMRAYAAVHSYELCNTVVNDLQAAINVIDKATSQPEGLAAVRMVLLMLQDQYSSRSDVKK